MKTRLFIFLTIKIFPLLSFFSNAQKIETEIGTKNCGEVENKIKDDIMNQKMVYYFFGIVPTKISKETKEILLKDYFLTIQQLGCGINSEITCNNHFINEYFVERNGKTVNVIIA